MRIEVNYTSAAPNRVLEEKIRDMMKNHLGGKQYCKGSRLKMQEQFMFFHCDEKSVSEKSCE